MTWGQEGGKVNLGDRHWSYSSVDLEFVVLDHFRKHGKGHLAQCERKTH